MLRLAALEDGIEARLALGEHAALEGGAEVRLALGEHAALAADLGDLLAVHPLREWLRAVRMCALYRAARRHEALASFEALRIRLAGSSAWGRAELVALQRWILTQHPGVCGGWR